MTSIERTAYPRFKRYYTAEELKNIYTPTTEEKLYAGQHTNNPSNYLNFLLLLKTFQRLGYFPKLRTIPPAIVNHLKQELSLPEDLTIGYENRKNHHRHRHLILEQMKVNQFNREGKNSLVKIVTEKAYFMSNPADLINVAIEELVKQSSELPSFRFLEREVARIRNQVHQLVYQQVISQLSPEYIERLNSLLLSHPVEQRTPYNQLKKLPKSATRDHLNELLVHRNWLETYGDVSHFLSGISNSLIADLAREASCLDAAELKDIAEAKRLTLLLCSIYSEQIITGDNLVEMFLKRMSKIHQLAEDELKKQRQKQQETIEKLVSVFGGVLMVLSSSEEDKEKEKEENSILNQVYSLLNSSGGLDQLVAECEAVNAYRGNNYLPLIWRFYKSHRRAFFRLINALELQSTTNDCRLMDAVKFLLDNAQRRGEWLKGEVDLSFVSAQWLSLVVDKKGKQTKIVRRHFEVCVFSYLAAEFKSGDVCVGGTSEYADWRKQLLSWDECQNLLAQYSEDLELPKDADSLVSSLKSLLTDTAAKVDSSYPQNEQLIINDDGEHV